MAAAYQGLQGPAIGKATSAINVVQRVAGAVGSALLAVVLQRAITTRLPGFHGGVAQAGVAAARDPIHVPPALAHAFGATFWVAVALTAVAIVPAVLIPPRLARQRHAGASPTDPGADAGSTAARVASSAPYLRPPWMQRHIGNRMSVLFRPSLVVRLTVVGRVSGKPRPVPVVVLEHNGERYLVSYRGESEWVRNLRAARVATLTRRDGTEAVHVVEVPVAERGELLEIYRERYGKMPTVAPVLRKLPDPADHPIFRIVARTADRTEVS
jgi:deazaflavin-dependent oxidoreductase (nitroreductase family)